MSRINENILNIMIVEDDRIFVKLHAHLIQRETNIEPTAFFGADEALEFLNENSDEDTKFLIFLDLNMPGRNGWEFIEICRKKPYVNNISIMIVTSSIYKADHILAKSYDEVIGFVSKPLKKENVWEAMKEFRLQESVMNGFSSVEKNIG